MSNCVQILVEFLLELPGYHMAYGNLYGPQGNLIVAHVE
jgi:hypothetical protein